MPSRFAALLLAALAGSVTADTLVHNITGYTLDDGKLRQFRALAFDQGRVTRLYERAEVATATAGQQRIDGQGATLLPGLIDAHGHLAGLGHALAAVDLVGSTSEAEAARRVAAFAADNPGQGWLLGRGWNQVLWPGRGFPTRASLDALEIDRPIALERVDGHAMWLNSAALAAAGFDDKTPDPEGGQILRDAEGAATGVLIDNAMLAVQAAIPGETDAQRAAVLLRALRAAAAFGLTSVHDAGIPAQDVRALQQLHRDGRMPIRVYAMLDVLDRGNDRYLEAGPMIDEQHMLDIRSVKVSADGALGSRGAALFADYSDAPGERGLLLLNDEQLAHHIERAMAAGYQVNTHAIGDLANARVLDFYQRLISKTGSRAARHRIEHAQILRRADIPRLAAAGVVASIQPVHATSDKNMAGDRLGQERLAGAYAWRQLLESGAGVAGGSDFPVESPNPFFGLHAAVTRQGQDGQPPGGWLPGEKLTREQALHLFTEGAARAAHQEAVVGRLLPGYAADFILVRDDFFSVPAGEIWNNQVLATYVAGRRVFPAD